MGLYSGERKARLSLGGWSTRTHSEATVSASSKSALGSGVSARRVIGATLPAGNELEVCTWPKIILRCFSSQVPGDGLRLQLVE